MVHIPDRDALTTYLRSRGLPAQHAYAEEPRHADQLAI